MKKAILTRLIAAALLLSMLCGCSGQAGSTQPADANSDSGTGKKRVVTIWYDGTEEKSANRAEAEFEELNPEIDIQFEIIPYADLATKEMVACQSSEGPDLMWQSYAWTNSFAKKGMLTSYNKYLENSEKVKLEDFDQTALELGTVGGEVYGLAWSTEAMCLVYNKNLFADAGLDPESPPKNWSEVVEYSKALTKDTDGDGTVDQFGYGLVGNLTGNTWFRFVPELWSAGGNVTNADMTESTLNSPEAIDALTHYASLLTEHKVAPTSSVNNGAAEVRTLFNNSKIGMYVDGQSAVKNIKNDAPDIDVGVALWPGKDGPLDAGLGGYYVAMPKNAKNPDDAWLFLEYFLSEEVQEWFPNAFPGNMKARDAERLNNDVDKIFAEQLSHTKNFQPLNDTPAAQQIILDAVQSVLSGAANATEALETAKESLDATLN